MRPQPRGTLADLHRAEIDALIELGNLTQLEVATAAGVDRSALTFFLGGRRMIAPSIAWLDRVYVALHAWHRDNVRRLMRSRRISRAKLQTSLRGMFIDGGDPLRIFLDTSTGMSSIHLRAVYAALAPPPPSLDHPDDEPDPPKVDRRRRWNRTHDKKSARPA